MQCVFFETGTAFLGAFPKLCPSTWNNSAPTGQIFMKFDFVDFFKICHENSIFIKIGEE
jgi:hypothetical protein